MSRELVLPDIMQLIDARGSLMWIHHPDSRSVHGRRGFPDLLIIGPRGILFREVKPSQYTALRAEQTTWRWLIMCRGLSWSVWAREDLESGRVERELDEIT